MTSPAFTNLIVGAVAAMSVTTLLLAGVAIAVHVSATRAVERRNARWRRWEPILLESLAGERPPSSLALLVADGERGDYFRLMITYALRLEGRSLDVLSEAAGPHLDAAIPLLRHPRADRRALAVHLLGLLGAPADVRRLQFLLRDPSPEVAMMTARALARSGDASFVRPVVDVLDRFETWGVPAVASMLSLFGVSATPALLASIADPSRTELARGACVEVLRLLGYPPAADAAVRLLEAEVPPPREVKAALLRLLRDIGGPGHAPIVRQLSADEDDVIRLHAVAALAAISLQPGDAALIENALSDPSQWVALRAAKGLIESGRVSSLQTVALETSARAAVAQQALAEAGLLVLETPESVA